MFNLRQKIIFKIVALGIIFTFLPMETCLARQRGKCRLVENIAIGVGMNVIPMPTQTTTFGQVAMSQVAAPAVSYGLSEAGLDDPIANAALTGGICGGISGGMSGGGYNGALVGAAQWSAAGATSSYLQQEGVHPALAGYGGAMAGQAAGGAMQGMLYKDPYQYEVRDDRAETLETLNREQVQERGGVGQLEQQLQAQEKSLTRTTTTDKDWAKKYESYKIESYKIETEGAKVTMRQEATASISPKEVKKLGVDIGKDKWYGVDLGAPKESGNFFYRKQDYSGKEGSPTLIRGEGELAKYDRAFRVVKTTSITPTKSMGQDFFGGAWEALKAPGLSYYVGEGLRAGILQLGYDKDTGETEYWAALAGPTIGSGVGSMVYEGTHGGELLGGTPWYGHALGGLTRGATIEGVKHYLIEKNDLSPLAAGMFGNLATGAIGGGIQYLARQQTVEGLNARIDELKADISALQEKKMDGGDIVKLRQYQGNLKELKQLQARRESVDIGLGASIGHGALAGHSSAAETFLTFGATEDTFSIVPSLRDTQYAIRVLDFAQDTWTETGFHYGNAVRKRMTNILFSQAGTNLGIPVRQVLTPTDYEIDQPLKSNLYRIRKQKLEELGRRVPEFEKIVVHQGLDFSSDPTGFGRISPWKVDFVERPTSSYEDYVANGGRVNDGRWFGPVSEEWYNANVLHTQPTTSRPTPLVEPTKDRTFISAKSKPETAPAARQVSLQPEIVAYSANNWLSPHSPLPLVPVGNRYLNLNKGTFRDKAPVIRGVVVVYDGELYQVSPRDFLESKGQGAGNLGYNDVQLKVGNKSVWVDKSNLRAIPQPVDEVVPASEDSVYFPTINVDPNDGSVSYELLRVGPGDE